MPKRKFWLKKQFLWNLQNLRILNTESFTFCFILISYVSRKFDVWWAKTGLFWRLGNLLPWPGYPTKLLLFISWTLNESNHCPLFIMWFVNSWNSLNNERRNDRFSIFKLVNILPKKVILSPIRGWTNWFILFVVFCHLSMPEK